MTEDPFEAHLQRAEACFRSGEPLRAGQIWQAILKRVPDHAAARQGLIRVKRALEETSAPAQPGLNQEELDTLLRQASQLWDLGVPDDAIEKWEKALQLDPENAEAKAFIGMVKKEQAEAAAAPPKPPPPLPAAREELTATLPTMVQEGEDPRMLQGEHLLVLERFEEAIYAFQQALTHQPGNTRAQEGLARARAGAHSLREPEQPASSREVALPATLTAAAPPRRLGLNIPAPLQQLVAHPLARSPVFWGVLVGSALVTSIGITYWRQAARDRQLRADVSRAIQDSIAPVLRASVIVDLDETPASILTEGKAVLSDDPLRAYHRAQEALRRSPQDTAAAQLLEEARRSLEQPVPHAAGTWEAKVKVGNLDGALDLLLGRLRSAPEDPNLLRKATSLLSARAQIQASKGDLEAARENLLRIRAFYPEDKAWSARIQLLDHIQAQPKGDQAGWIALLG